MESATIINSYLKNLNLSKDAEGNELNTDGQKHFWMLTKCSVKKMAQNAH